MASVLDFDVDCDENKEQFLFNNDYHHLRANLTYGIMSDVSSTFGKFDNIIYQTKSKTTLDVPEPIPEYTPVEWEDDPMPIAAVDKYGPITGAANTVIVIDTQHSKTFTFYAYNTATKTVTVDWGDGNTENVSLTAKKVKQITHDYSAVATKEYTITISDTITSFGMNTASAQNNNVIAVRGLGKSIATLSVATFYNEQHMKYFHCCDNTSIKNFTNAFVKSSTVVNNENAWNVVEKITLSGCTAMTAFPFYGGTADAKSNIYFPKLSSIDSYAFAGCSKLASIDIGRTAIEEIKGYAFKDCTTLKTLICYAATDDARFNKLSAIRNNAFDNCAFAKFGAGKTCSPLYNSSRGTHPSEIIVENNAFSNCASLTATTASSFDNISPMFKTLEFLPNTIKTIAQKTITSNSGITTIRLPRALVPATNQTYAMFINCTALTSITYNDGDNDSFSGSGIQYIANNCANLKYLEVSPNAIAMQNTYLAINCDNIETLILPDGLTSIYSNNVMPAATIKNLKVPFIGLSRYGAKGYAETNSVSADTNKLMGTMFNSSYAYSDGQGYYKIQQCYQSTVKGVVKLDTARMVPETLTNLSVGAFLWLHTGAFSNLSSLQTITFTQPPIDGPSKWSGLSAFYGCHNLLSVFFDGMQHSLFDNYGFSETSYNENKFPPLQGLTNKHTVRYVFADGYYEWDSVNSKYKFTLNS